MQKSRWDMDKDIESYGWDKYLYLHKTEMDCGGRPKGISWEGGHMWYLSCMVEKDLDNLPSIKDIIRGEKNWCWGHSQEQGTEMICDIYQMYW